MFNCLIFSGNTWSWAWRAGKSTSSAWARALSTPSRKLIVLVSCVAICSRSKYWQTIGTDIYSSTADSVFEPLWKFTFFEQILPKFVHLYILMCLLLKTMGSGCNEGFRTQSEDPVHLSVQYRRGRRPGFHTTYYSSCLGLSRRIL